MEGTMTDEEKRELARHLLPHLAWDLSRSSVYTFAPTEGTSGASARMFVEQISQQITAMALHGEAFTVAIIPAQKESASAPL